MMTLTRSNTIRMTAVLLCSAALALPATAQNDGPPPPPPGQGQGPGGPGGPGGFGGRRGGNPEQRLAMMTRQLDLTPDQSAKVKLILEDSRTQMQALRGDGAAPGDNREKMEALRKTETEKINAVLNADQKTKLEEMEKRQRERMRDGGGPGGRPGGPGGDGPAPPPPPPQS